MSFQRTPDMKFVGKRMSVACGGGLGVVAAEQNWRLHSIPRFSRPALQSLPWKGLPTPFPPPGNEGHSGGMRHGDRGQEARMRSGAGASRGKSPSTHTPRPRAPPQPVRARPSPA